MADKKITALPATAGANLTDLLAKVNDPSGVPVTQKLTLTQLKTLMAAADLIIDNIDLTVNACVNDVAHGLGATPSRVRFVMKIIAGLSTFNIGDEVDGETVFDQTALDDPFSWGANATVVWLASNGAFGAANCGVIPRGGGALTTPTGGTAVGKLYLWK